MINAVSSKLRQRPVEKEDVLYVLNREVIPTLSETVSRLNELLELLRAQAPAAEVALADVGAVFDRAALNSIFGEVEDRLNVLTEALGLEP